MTSAREAARRRICALFDACRAADTPDGTRDAALLSVLFGARVARPRALRLAVDAYEGDTGRLHPHRTVLPPAGSAPPPRRARAGARRALDDWLRARGTAAGPLLCALSAGEARVREALTSPDVDAVLGRWGRRAGIERCEPGAFRRLYRSPWWEVHSPPGSRGTPDSGHRVAT